MATHRDYKISRWSSDEALVCYYEGEYQGIVPELGGDAVSTYVRTAKVREVLFRFDGDCTERKLRTFLNDKLNVEGALTSIPEQVRKSAPVLKERTIA